MHKHQTLWTCICVNWTHITHNSTWTANENFHFHEKFVWFTNGIIIKLNHIGELILRSHTANKQAQGLEQSSTTKVPEGLLEFETRTNTRGNGYKLTKLRCNSSTRQHFFSHRITDMWNSLPDYIVGAPSVNAFKNRLDKAMEEYTFVQTWSVQHHITPGESPVAIANYRQFETDLVEGPAVRSPVDKSRKVQE
jgi:hypothetical protein